MKKGNFFVFFWGGEFATADAAYSCIAGFGLTVIAAFLVSQQRWIHLIGGLFLIYLGIRTFLTRPAARAAVAKANTFFGAYVSTFLLTLTNPLTILSFVAIFAGIGVGGAGKGYLAALMVVLGVFAGSALWWCVLTGGGSLLRGKFNSRWFEWIKRD